MYYYYRCSYQTSTIGRRMCFNFDGRELDEAIVKRVLNVLGRPPVEMLQESLEEARRAETAKAKNLEAERQRLERREGLLRDQFEACNPRYHALYTDLQEQLNALLEEKEKFNLRLIAGRSRPRIETTEKELEELCQLAREVPKIWHNSLVTDQERKEILRCLIQKIVVDITPETIKATIHWTSGTETNFEIYRREGKYKLIAELHAQGYNPREISDRLARGESSTGQTWKLAASSLYKGLKLFGLKPHKNPSWYKAVEDEAVRLQAQGWTRRQIAKLFNSRGLRTSIQGVRWTEDSIKAMTVKRNC